MGIVWLLQMGGWEEGKLRMLEIEQEIRKDGLKLNPTFGSTNKE